VSIRADAVRQTPAATRASAPAVAWTELVAFALLGVGFGIVLVKGQIVSWFRIQEMFRFQAFHMYGVLFSAVIVAGLSLAILRRLEARTRTGELIRLAPKEMGTGTRYWAGGTLFGVGWALTGACPGPLVALMGAGFHVFWVAFLAAIAGTLTYGWLRPKLPH
jgi:uncharacterized protein